MNQSSVFNGFSSFLQGFRTVSRWVSKNHKKKIQPHVPSLDPTTGRTKYQSCGRCLDPGEEVGEEVEGSSYQGEM